MGWELEVEHGVGTHLGGDELVHRWMMALFTAVLFMNGMSTED